jgi:hypothetical protein
MSDAKNCGDCGVVCPDGICLMGTCAGTCNTADIVCFCPPNEVECIACDECPGQPPPPNVARIRCTPQGCTILSCHQPYFDVNGDFADGCECKGRGMFLTAGEELRVRPRLAQMGSGEHVGVVWQDHRRNRGKAFFDWILMSQDPLVDHGDEELSVSWWWWDERHPDIFWDQARNQFISVWATERTVFFLPVGPTGAHGWPVDALRERFFGNVTYSPAVARASSAYMLVWAESNRIMLGALDYDGLMRYFDPCDLVNWNEWGETDPDGNWLPWDRNSHHCFIEGWHPWMDQLTSAPNPQDVEILGSGDQFVVVWQEGSGTSHGIRVQRVGYMDGSWNNWYTKSSPISVSGPFSDARHPVLSPAGSGYLLGFDARKNGGNREAYVAWLGSDGSVIRGPIQVSDASGAGRNVSGAAAAWRDSNQIGVFYTERGAVSDDQAHMFRALNGEGALLAPRPIIITEENWDMARELRPTGAVFAAGRYGALYTEVEHYSGEPPCDCMKNCLSPCGDSCTDEQKAQCAEFCEDQCGGGWMDEIWYGVRFLTMCPPQ